MRKIPWVNILERDREFSKVIHSYPFPDVSDEFVFDNYRDCAISLLRRELENIKDANLRTSQLNRLSFILDIWHPKNFVEVEMKDWKYS